MFLGSYSGAVEVSVVWVILAFCLRTSKLSKNGRHPTRIVAHTVPQKNIDLYLSKPALGPNQISYLMGTGVLSQGIKQPGHDADH
jgi:hypothetical protein